MYFLLHHATGVLVLQAKSRDEVMNWSQRQLVSASSRFSILDWLDAGLDDIESSGTGIHASRLTNCEARLSIMPDAVQPLAFDANEPRLHRERPGGFGRGPAPTVAH